MRDVKKFKTFDEAKTYADQFTGKMFPNRFQFPGENQSATVREYGGFEREGKLLPRYFCVQFGDCGPYALTRDVYNSNHPDA